MFARTTNLKRERESHDDICHHYVLQVNNKVGPRRDAEEHPHRHTIEGKPHQQKTGVQNGENHRLQNVVPGAGAVSVALTIRILEQSGI